MVDRKARNRLAEMLRHLVAGQITNDEFEDSFQKTKDRACWVISHQAWFLYSDLHQHKLIGRHAVSRNDKKAIARCMLFLYSDIEYEWPKHRYEGIKGLVNQIVTLGLLARRYDREWKASGDFQVWPFIRRTEYLKSLESPKLLKGVQTKGDAA